MSSFVHLFAGPHDKESSFSRELEILGHGCIDVDIANTSKADQDLLDDRVWVKYKAFLQTLLALSLLTLTVMTLTLFTLTLVQLDPGPADLEPVDTDSHPDDSGRVVSDSLALLTVTLLTLTWMTLTLIARPGWPCL